MLSIAISFNKQLFDLKRNLIATFNENGLIVKTRSILYTMCITHATKYREELRLELIKKRKIHNFFFELKSIEQFKNDFVCDEKSMNWVNAFYLVLSLTEKLNPKQIINTYVLSLIICSPTIIFVSYSKLFVLH